MNPIKQESSQEYKECAGKGCQKEGKIELTVQYLNKRGCFCESCAEDLLCLGLVKQDVDVTHRLTSDRKDYGGSYTEVLGCNHHTPADKWLGDDEMI
jgi:hypothetical protein